MMVKQQRRAAEYSKTSVNALTDATTKAGYPSAPKS